ncbi:RNA polymerase sigma-70 factor [Mariniphaga sediminis]|uniref:RNA polymerase sigma-70 factor n=1 Tax=Mariniphaga sediminis TaxID=1628158 RepID=A0A399CW09_9BACT|nr:RNA polymerase sigma-70 factor [Mariniphaga sediminis]RIH63577.1 RNA polymerase sigma-70 factor [Mariniphaga sediminis]
MQIIGGIAEKDLILRLKNGDQTAFELLFHFYYPGLVMYASQFTANLSDAEEIVQDFFVRFWEKHNQVLPCDSLKNYFFSSVKYGSLDFLKHQEIERKYVDEIVELSKHHLAYDTDLYVVSELQERLKQGIDLLPEKCREVFMMSRIQGLKNEEIAAELNISKRTVETQISKALKVLREELKDYVGLLFFLGI